MTKPVPVEPSLLVSLRNGMSINDNPNILDTECDALLKHIDALKAYALKEKERADGLQKIQDEAESLLFSVGDITCSSGHKHVRHDGCLYCVKEKAESELAALRGRMKDALLLLGGIVDAYSSVLSPQACEAINKQCEAMSVELLKEVGE